MQACFKVRAMSLEILQIQVFWNKISAIDSDIQPIIRLFDRFTKDPHSRVRQVALRALSRWNRKKDLLRTKAIKENVILSDKFPIVRMEILFLNW
jgi:hypothetical protein